MALVTIVIGVLLTLLGVGTYTNSLTALIPAVFGVVLIVLGALSFKATRRKHTMHAAVMVGLIGFVMPAWRLIGHFKDESGAAAGAQLAMALICALFVGLCVNSFIHARRNRKA
jgi:hypothetical protein